MESLKPLKIIGGLALLCLIIYLALPAGRLNFAERIRTLQNETSQSAAFKGPNSELLIAMQGKSINVGAGMPHEFAGATRLLQIGLQSNNPSVLAIASRNSYIPILTKYKPTKAEWIKIAEYIQELKAVAEKGARLDPENAFFPLQMATYVSFEGDRDAVKKYLLQAEGCKYYNEYGWEEGDIKIKALKFQPSEFERQSINSTIFFNHLAQISKTLKGFVGNVAPEKNIEDRILVAKIGVLIAKESKYTTTHLFGRGVISTSTKSYEPGNTVAIKSYDADLLESIAVAKNLDSGHLFKASEKYSENISKELNDAFGEWQRLFNLWPAINALPLYSLLTAVLLVITVLLSSKYSTKPWFRSIRYLGALAILSPMAFSYQTRYVQSSVGTILALICVPLALIAYTERFIPVIHVSIVAFAIWALEPQIDIAIVIIEMSLGSILAILAWHKNRRVDSTTAKNLDLVLILLIPIASICWIVKSGEFAPVRSFLDSLTFWLFLGAIGLASSDKMRGRFQANLISSVGLAMFIASLIINIQSTARLASFPELDRIAISKYKEEFMQAISDPNSATNPIDSGVKPSK